MPTKRKPKRKAPSAPRRQGKKRTARDKRSMGNEAKKRHDRAMRATGRGDLVKTRKKKK